MFPHNWFGAVGNAVRRGPLGAGEKGVLRPLTPWSKDVAARTRAWDAQSRFAAKLRHKCVQVCLPITGGSLLPDARQLPTFSSEKK